MTAAAQLPLPWDRAERKKLAGQKQAASGLPAGTRAHVLDIARAIIRSGMPFTFPPCDGYRSVAGELAPMQRAIVETHPNFYGNVTTQLQKSGEIVHVGRAKTQSHDKRRYVGVWQSPNPR